MAKFIDLKTSQGEIIYLNVENIASFISTSNGDGSKVKFNNEIITVSESPEEIYKKIKL